MRLSFIEVSGFRGICKKTRFDIPRGYAIISGANGVGKSTMIDAVEFAFTGSLSKYSISDTARATAQQYIWWLGSGEPDGYYVAVGVVSDAGEEVIVKRTRERGLVDISTLDLSSLLSSDPDQSSDVVEQICRLSIIRDEMIPKMSIDQSETERFHTVSAAVGTSRAAKDVKRARNIVDAAESSEKSASRAYEHSRSRVQDLVEQISRLRALSVPATDVAAAQRILQEELSLSVEQPGTLDDVRRRVADGRVKLMEMRAVLDELARHFVELSESSKSQRKAEIAGLNERRSTVFSEIERAESQLTDLGSASASSPPARILLSLLEKSENVGLLDGHCPVCDSRLTETQFRRGMESAKARLARESNDAAKLITALSRLQQELKDLRNHLAEMNARIASLDSEVATSQAIERSLLSRASSLNPKILALDDINTIDDDARGLSAWLARVERALQMVAVSENSSVIAALERDLQSSRKQAADAERELARATNVVHKAKALDHSVRRCGNEISEERLAMIGPLLGDLYQRLRPHIDWRKIEYRLRGDVRRFLKLSIGDDLDPQFMFSSGQRRAAGLAFLLAVYLANSSSKWQSLILDDPVQHIDDYRALNLVEVLGAVRRDDRQIICAVEDVALARLLTRRLRSSYQSPGAWYHLEMDSSNAPVARYEAVQPLPTTILSQGQVS
jgi:DNA repair exonuclease SbcCD ATPase subunit